MASLELTGIVKRFGPVEALKGVDLTVADGEFCVLLGPSGCGKSTLLSIIAGLLAQDEGAVRFDGQPVDRLSPRERDIAMVFQSYALYPHMTVARNLGFGLKMRKVPKQTIDKQVRETAKLLGIEDLLDRKPRELSGGQRQRVAMGRALVRRPKLFLLDEPLSNLDARLRASVRIELKQLHYQVRGTTVYVTHDQVEAMTLGDRVVVMRAGLICQVGPPEEVYNQPADTFVATFIGSPEMNLYRGSIRRREGRAFFDGAGFSVELAGWAAGVDEGEAALGLRPEDLRLGPAEGGLMSLEAGVDLLSNIGSEKYLHGRLGQEPLTARMDKEARFSEGENVPLAIEPRRVHLFRQGRRISSPDEP